MRWLARGAGLWARGGPSEEKNNAAGWVACSGPTEERSTRRLDGWHARWARGYEFCIGSNCCQVLQRLRTLGLSSKNRNVLGSSPEEQKNAAAGWPARGTELWAGCGPQQLGVDRCAGCGPTAAGSARRLTVVGSGGAKLAGSRQASTCCTPCPGTPQFNPKTCQLKALDQHPSRLTPEP